MAKGGHELRKVFLGPAMTDPLHPAGGSPLKGLAAVSGVACPQVRQTMAVLFPIGHPTFYAYAFP